MIGLALSGGGSRGIAHLGVYKAILEQNHTISHVAGTSAGAIAGALIASNIRPEDGLEMVKSLEISKIFKPALSFGLLNLDKAEKIIDGFLPIKTFEDLSIKLTITGTDITNGKLVYFNTGMLVPAILCSICIPGIFQPIKYDGKLFVDGGVMNNLPIEVLTHQNLDIIASNVTPLGNNYPAKNVKDVLKKSFYLAINQNIDYKKSKCKYYIEPQLPIDLNILSTLKANQLFEIGYLAAKEALKA